MLLIFLGFGLLIGAAYSRSYHNQYSYDGSSEIVASIDCNLPVPSCHKNNYFCAVNAYGKEKDFSNLCQFKRYYCAHLEEDWDIKQGYPCSRYQRSVGYGYDRPSSYFPRASLHSLNCTTPWQNCFLAMTPQESEKPICGVNKFGKVMQFVNKCTFKKYFCEHLLETWDDIKEGACVGMAATQEPNTEPPSLGQAGAALPADQLGLETTTRKPKRNPTKSNLNFLGLL